MSLAFLLIAIACCMLAVAQLLGMVYIVLLFALAFKLPRSAKRDAALGEGVAAILKLCFYLVLSVAGILGSLSMGGWL